MNPSLNNPFPPDTELVTRSLAGEHQAFGTLVTRHQGAACGVAYSVCGDFPASEDVAQEAFVSAWKQLGTLRETGRFRAWVCGIARQIALSQIRRRDRRGDRPTSDAPNETAMEDASPRDDAILSEESALLWQTLDRLPEAYREPLVLFYREQQSVNAVATALDLSEDSVKQRLSRGRAMLREELAQQIEGVLGRTQPGTAFTAAVLSALPPIVIGTGLTVGVSSAKAATVSGASSTATVGGTTGAAIVPSVASGAVGLLSLYVFFRFLRSPEIPKNIRRIIARTAVGSFVIAVFFAGFILWIALTRGAPLIAWGFTPALVLTLAIGAFVMLNVALSLRASRLLASLPLNKNAHLVRGYRYVSHWQLAGLPVLCLAFGPDHCRNERRGTARGWIAIGDVAFGFVAIGAIAVGPIAIGGVSLGILALGGGAAGLVTLGGVAIGWASCGGAALAWDFAAGGLAIAHNLAFGGLALASEQAFGGIALAPHANDPSAWAGLNAHPVYGTVIALLPQAGWLSLLSLPGLIIALRHLRRNKL